LKKFISWNFWQNGNHTFEDYFNLPFTFKIQIFKKMLFQTKLDLEDKEPKGKTNHVVKIVGWGQQEVMTDKGRRTLTYWIVVNSWSKGRNRSLKVN
jgi:C1A family cysteine protease